MQQFDYVPMHVAGESETHAIADCLSRLHGPVRKTSISAAAVVTRAAARRAKAGDSACALNQFEPIKSVRGKSHLRAF